MTPSLPSGSWAHAAETAVGAAAGVARVATDATRELIDFLLPGSCAACGGPATGGLCADCLAGCRCVEAPRCSSCGAPWPGSGRRCGRCLRFGRAFAFRRALALWRYRGPVQRLVHGFKYEGRRDVLRLFGRRLGEAAHLAPVFAGRPLVVPVPARRASRRKRGYDQASGLALGLAASRDLPVELGALVRRRQTAVAQSASPGPRRRRQLGAAFRARPACVEGRGVLLVDDVLSTGGTADAATRALLCAGATHVDVVVLAT